MLGLALAGFVGSGCASTRRAAQAPPLHGFVRLGALVQNHPGWSGVARYDGALKQLEAAVSTLPPPGRPDEKIAVLSALPGEPGITATALSPLELKQISGRLAAVQQSLTAGLRERRELARADQLRVQQSVWRREARLQYPVPTETAAIQPDLELQLLEANVKTLTQTLANWKDSTPPAPKRAALRVKVEADRALLEKLIADRLSARETARTDHLADIARRRAERLSFIQAKSDELEGRLRADDERVITAHTLRLAKQQATLLEALGETLSLGVPTVGEAGAKSLPSGRGTAQAALSQASLTEAETRLRAQKTRWVQYLYADTQAAAQDTADQKNWNITFGTPRRGDRDLTQALAQAMAAGVWHLNTGRHWNQESVKADRMRL